jgi:hypothetical protein
MRTSSAASNNVWPSRSALVFPDLANSIVNLVSAVRGTAPLGSVPTPPTISRRICADSTPEIRENAMNRLYERRRPTQEKHAAFDLRNGLTDALAIDYVRLYQSIPDPAATGPRNV